MNTDDINNTETEIPVPRKRGRPAGSKSGTYAERGIKSKAKIRQRSKYPKRLKSFTPEKLHELNSLLQGMLDASRALRPALVSVVGKNALSSRRTLIFPEKILELMQIIQADYKKINTQK